MRKARVIAALLVAFACALGLGSAAGAGSPSDPAFIDTLVDSGLTAPTAMAWDPDGRLWVNEQGGAVRVIKKGELLPTPFVSITVDSTGERGLLGIAFDPNFKQNHYVYVYYTKRATGPDPPRNQVSRFTANGEVAVPRSEVRIFRFPGLVATNHNGGAIHFGRDGKLYVAVGDNDRKPRPSQLLDSLFGKVVRINPDGTIPTDNPYYSNPAVKGLNKAIWAIGFRNPFTFAPRPGTDRLFVNDVGAHKYEEVDDVAAGGNYGWPNCEGPFKIETTTLCNSVYPSYQDPFSYYEHGTNGSTGCAIVGGSFAPSPSSFPASYAGDYFFADLCTGWIRQLDVGTASASEFATNLSAPVDIQFWRDGALYYLERGTGSVRRISYAGQPTLATPDPTSGSAGTKVKLRGTYLAGATSVTFNGVPASFTVVWDTWIRTVVPAGATSGPIEVTTPGGTASQPFTVTP